VSVRGTGAGLAALARAPAGTDPTVAGAVPVWVKVASALGFAALAAAATTNAITLFTLPAAGVIHGVKIKHSTSFGGGGITAYTLSVGIVGTANKYASAFDVFQAVSNTAFQLTNVVGSENHGAGTIIQVTATSTTANLNAATTGAVDIWALLSEAL
jgi:SNF family Na+-dependent transporter